MPLLSMALLALIALAHPELGASFRRFPIPSLSSLDMTKLFNTAELPVAITSKPKIPMQPINPIPLNPSLDYFNHIFSFLENMKQMESDIKKRTYGYGLMIVGRPLDELSFSQKLLRAALMPSKYYEDATSFFIQRLHNYINSTSINKAPAPVAKPDRAAGWGRFLRRLFNMPLSPVPASSIPTPAIKARAHHVPDKVEEEDEDDLEQIE